MRSVSSVVLAAACTLLPIAAAHAAAGAPTAPKPKITVRQAEAAATKKVPGRAQSAKYEFEDGHWQYAVIVQAKGGSLYEVEVNSTTGKVTDTEKTSAAEEATEAAADKAAAVKTGGK